MTLRRQFELLPEDRQFLDEYGLPWETIVDGSPWVLIHDFPTPRGYNHATRHRRDPARDRLPEHRSSTWSTSFRALARKDGKPIGATEAKQALDGKSFQRWSRHRTAQTRGRSAATISGLMSS